MPDHTAILSGEESDKEDDAFYGSDSDATKGNAIEAYNVNDEVEPKAIRG